MASVSDFDRLQGLLGDKGKLLGTGNGTVIVQPKPAGDTTPVSEHHSVSHLTYMDTAGHVHAVLLDSVLTIDSGPPLTESQTIEILSDVVIT
jgi:hypothetical protein